MKETIKTKPKLVCEYKKQPEKTLYCFRDIKL
jgi:hypothetical protein